MSYHIASVRCVAFSPDGAVLASGSEDTTVVLADVDEGKERQTLTHHTCEIRCVAFSPDGAVLASGSVDKTVALTDLRTGTVLRTLTHHSGGVYCVAFSPEGAMLASGAYDDTLVLADPRSGKVLHMLDHHTEEVRCVAFSPDGAVLASGSEDETVVLIDPWSGKVLHTLKHHAERVNCVAIPPDGTVLATGSDDKTMVLERNKVFDKNEAEVAAITSGNLMQFVEKAKASMQLDATAIIMLCAWQRAQITEAAAQTNVDTQSGMRPWIDALDKLPGDCTDDIVIAVHVRRSLFAEYERAVASGAAGVAEAALVLRAHIETVLCLPLQELVDNALAKPNTKDQLFALTTKLRDASWWYTRAVIAPMQDVYANKLLEEVRLADLDALREVADQRLYADLKIYSAIHDKEKLKPEYSKLAAEVAKLEADVRARCKEKPRQPGPESEDAPMTVAQVKAQAADVHAAYRKLVVQVAEAAGVAEDGVKISAMKGAYRMLQKAVRTAKAASAKTVIGDCRSICDVNRALLTAKTPAHARKIVAEIIKHPRVEIMWVKDRINHPTDGGWCDVLMLFSINGTNGHVNEVQVAFKNMILQRTAGESHQAYTQARDAIETIEAAGSEFVKKANADSAKLLEENVQLLHKNRDLTQQLNALKDRNTVLLAQIVKHRAFEAESRSLAQRELAQQLTPLTDEVERLRAELVALRCAAGSDTQ